MTQPPVTMRPHVDGGGVLSVVDVVTETIIECCCHGIPATECIVCAEGLTVIERAEDSRRSYEEALRAKRFGKPDKVAGGRLRKTTVIPCVPRRTEE